MREGGLCEILQAAPRRLVCLLFLFPTFAPLESAGQYSSTVSSIPSAASSPPRSPSPCLSSVEEDSEAKALRLRFEDARETAFHFVWLWDNSPDIFDPSSGQRLHGIGAGSSLLSSTRDLEEIKPVAVNLLKTARSSNNNASSCFDTLEVRWPPSSGSSSSTLSSSSESFSIQVPSEEQQQHQVLVARFDSSWLRDHAYDKESLLERDLRMRSRTFVPYDLEETSSSKVSDPYAQFPQVSWEEIMRTDENDFGLLRWLERLSEHGWCLVSGVPDEDQAVLRLAERIAPVSHAAQYGQTFQVKSAENPANIAYSSLGIPPHMDLAYYESPPGLQLLHCRKMASGGGGESLLYDAHALAEVLRERDPQAFLDLARIPATFTKKRAQANTEQAASSSMREYRRPHIGLTDSGEVHSVFWSPPFAGPLRCAAEDVPKYYRAARSFAALMEDEELNSALRIRFALKPGYALTFNQRRMLHGRESFRGGARHLEGAYVNIDDFQSKLLVLSSFLRGGNPMRSVQRRVGNQAI